MSDYTVYQKRKKSVIISGLLLRKVRRIKNMTKLDKKDKVERCIFFGAKSMNLRASR